MWGLVCDLLIVVGDLTAVCELWLGGHVPVLVGIGGEG